MERVFAMKNVRIYYKKLDRMKFISHLDMTRFMSRVITRSKIPVWYTEGFNQHIYMNFALPLSLGFESEREIVDIRLTDDSFEHSEVLKALSSVSIDGIEFTGVEEPVLATKEIGFSVFELRFDGMNEELKAALCDFLSWDAILCEKVGKKGKVKQIDLIPKIKNWSLNEDLLTLTLVAGSEDNLNPSLVLSTFFEQTNTDPIDYSVTRTAILDKNGNDFK